MTTAALLLAIAALGLSCKARLRKRRNLAEERMVAFCAKERTY